MGRARAPAWDWRNSWYAGSILTLWPGGRNWGLGTRKTRKLSTESESFFLRNNLCLTDGVDQWMDVKFKDEKCLFIYRLEQLEVGNKF